MTYVDPNRVLLSWKILLVLRRKKNCIKILGTGQSATSAQYPLLRNQFNHYLLAKRF